MKSITWGKGLFRLWVLLSFMWAIFILAIMWSSFEAPFYGGHTIYSGANSDETSTMYSPEWGKFSNLVNQNIYKKYEIQNFPLTDVFVDANLSSEEISRRMKRTALTAEKLKNDVIRSKRIELSGIYLLFVVLPSVAVFVLGIGILWVLKGFRRVEA